MRQGATRLGWSSIVTLAVLAVAGCGGGGHRRKAETASTETASTVATKTTPGPAGAGAPSVSIRPTPGTTFGSSVTAKPGETVLLRTIVAGTETSGPETVGLTVGGGPSRSLTVAATAGGHRSAVTIKSANGKPVTLVRLRYNCPAPPSPSFCPAKRESFSQGAYQLQFATRHHTAIVLDATVGPISTPAPPVRPASSAVVATYKPTEVMEAESPPPAGVAKPGPTKVPVPATTVTAKPGDTLVMITRLGAKLVGAPQATTVTINRRPARTLTISATVGDGTASTATVKSADHSPIELVLPHYVCFVAPTPTFCPASKADVGSHRYKLTFPASPQTALIVLATVKAER